jgi:sulfonate transport system permease protein
MTRGEKLVAVAAPVSIVLLWQIAVSTRFLNPGLFPPPSEIAANFVEYAKSGELAKNTAWTLGRLVIGCLIGGVPGTLI